jgi:toxin ParE1/3/4
MRYEVLLSASAERDLEELYDYIGEFDSPTSAGAVIERLLAVVDGVARFPERGAHPRELLELGIRTYRQVTFKPYRVIYRVLGRRVVIDLIVDGRRDLQTLLARRLLRG